MGYLKRCIVSALVSAGICLAMTVSAFAETSNLSCSRVSGSIVSTDESQELSGFTLISEERFVDENNFYIVDRTYVENETEAYSVNATKSGSKTIKKSRSIYGEGTSSGDLWVIMWVQGDFSWNSEKDTATVKNAKRWQEIREQFPDNATISEEKFEYDSNQGMTFLAGFKYAYIENVIHVANQYTVGHDYRIWLDVNINGDVNFQT